MVKWTAGFSMWDLDLVYCVIFFVAVNMKFGTSEVQLIGNFTLCKFCFHNILLLV